MIYNEGYQFVGMHYIWWFIWIIFLVWIFAIPYDIPGQRLKKDSPLDLLKKRLAVGEIDINEYHEKKKIIEQ